MILLDKLLIWPLLGGFLALLVALYLALDLLKMSRGSASMIEFSRAIRAGVKAYLSRIYQAIAVFVVIGVALILLTQFLKPEAPLDWRAGGALIIGALCASLAGLVGMLISTRANHRTAAVAQQAGMGGALSVAIGGGAVMGLAVAGFSLIGLSLILLVFHVKTAIIAAFALGASGVALLTRLSGGIYKGADIGADLAGKIQTGLSADDARNPATLADHAGDHIGEVMGLGLDLMESFLEAMIACLIIAAGITYPSSESRAGILVLPLLIASWGVVAAIAGIFFIRLFVKSDPQRGLMFGAILALGLTILGAWFIVSHFGLNLPGEGKKPNQPKSALFVSILIGFVAGALVSYFSVFYTSLRFRSSHKIAEKSPFGPALTVLEGVGAGLRSCAAPALTLAAAIILSWQQAGLYGITLASFGMLATVGMIVAVNAYCPIVDNAGGIAEMVRLDRSVREIIDNLHVAGNTMTAVGKGFAVFSSAMVALGLLLAFFKTAGLKPATLALSDPRVLAGLVVGGMFPCYFASLLLRAVSVSACSIIDEVRRQCREIPAILEGHVRPDYAPCMEIASRKAFGGMLLPAGLVIALPLVVGFVLGKQMLAGVLIGSVISGLVLALQMVNSGGALDNAKRTIEEGYFGGPGSPAHQAAVVGDMVGDSFKDTVGPAVNILIKLICVLSLTIAPLL